MCYEVENALAKISVELSNYIVCKQCPCERTCLREPLYLDKYPCEKQMFKWMRKVAGVTE